jgi:xanthine dehydrogenase molybdopterin-binding subunit B
VPLSDVHVADTATDKVANSQPSAASQSTDLYGMATLNACEQIRKRLEPVAAAMKAQSGTEVYVYIFILLINTCMYRRKLGVVV